MKLFTKSGLLPFALAFGPLNVKHRYRHILDQFFGFWRPQNEYIHCKLNIDVLQSQCFIYKEGGWNNIKRLTSYTENGQNNVTSLQPSLEQLFCSIANLTTIPIPGVYEQRRFISDDKTNVFPFPRRKPVALMPVAIWLRNIYFSPTGNSLRTLYNSDRLYFRNHSIIIQPLDF